MVIIACCRQPARPLAHAPSPPTHHGPPVSSPPRPCPAIERIGAYTRTGGEGTPVDGRPPPHQPAWPSASFHPPVTRYRTTTLAHRPPFPLRLDDRGKLGLRHGRRDGRYPRPRQGEGRHHPACLRLLPWQLQRVVLRLVLGGAVLPWTRDRAGTSRAAHFLWTCDVGRAETSGHACCGCGCGYDGGCVTVHSRCRTSTYQHCFRASHQVPLRDPCASSPRRPTLGPRN